MQSRIWVGAEGRALCLERMGLPRSYPNRKFGVNDYFGHFGWICRSAQKRHDS